MAVSFVGAQGNAADTVTIPTHQADDLILIFAYRDGNNSAPTTPSAGGTVPTWNLIGSSGSNNNSSNFRWAVATGSTTTSGTWTNATEMICLVYRGARIGASAGNSGNATTTVNYPGLTLQRTDDTSWVAGVAGHRTATDVDTAPGAMVNRASTGTEAAGHDTNATVTTWGSTSVTVNASSAYRSWTVELRDTTYELPVDKGTYTLTGNTVTLTVGGGLNNYTLAVDAGAYTLTGQPAGLTVQRRLPVDKGTYTLTGQPVTLSRSYQLPVDRGVYTLTGRPVTLSQGGGLNNYTLTVDAGAYTYTGSDPGLLRTRILPVDTGAYSLTGQPITVARGYRLMPDKGTYIYTGRPVILNGQAPNTRYILIT